MINCMAQPNETRLECAQIEGFERERFEKLLGLSRRFDRRVVWDRFADEPAVDSVDRTARKLQDGPPGRLESNASSRLGEDRIEAADSRFGACSGNPFDQPRETIEPRIERKYADELENAAECRQGQHAIGFV